MTGDIEDIIRMNVPAQGKVLILGDMKVLAESLKEAFYVVKISESREVVRGIQNRYVPVLRSLGWYDPRIIARHIALMADAYAVVLCGPANEKRHIMRMWLNLLPKDAPIWIFPGQKSSVTARLAGLVFANQMGRDVQYIGDCMVVAKSKMEGAAANADDCA